MSISNLTNATWLDVNVNDISCNNLDVVTINGQPISEFEGATGPTGATGATGTIGSTVSNLYVTGLLETGSTGGIKLGNSISGYTASLLNYYEGGTFNVNYTGVRNSTILTHFTRIGSFVNILSDADLGTTGNASGQLASAGSIPARLRPTTNLEDTGIRVYSNNSGQNGMVIIGSDGSVQIYATAAGGAFSSAGVGLKGPASWSITYSIT